MKTMTRISAGLLSGMIVLSGVSAASAATHFVTVSGFSFVPADLTVTNGDTVTLSGGGNFHTVTGDDADPFCGTDFFATCSVTFRQVGTFRYHCIPHVNRGMRGVIRVVAGVTSPLTIVIHGQGTVTPNLNGRQLSVGSRYTLTAQPAAGFAFVKWTGGLTSSVPTLQFVMKSNLVLEANFADVAGPKVTIVAPAVGARLETNRVTLRGTARDNVAVNTVEYQVENSGGTSDWRPVSGTTNWSAEVSDLALGTNLFRVRARDAEGNLSVAARNVSVLARLTVTTNGPGRVSQGFLGTTFREVGRRFSLQATPGAGFLFSHWSGGTESGANPLVFVLRSNLDVQANFAPNPFLPIKGSYNGLFIFNDPTKGVQHQSSGFFTFLLTGGGKYSGLLKLAGRQLPFAGKFNLAGEATNSVKRPGTNALTLELLLDLSGGTERVTGRVIDTHGGWVAELNGDRAPTYDLTNTASPHQGKYTLIMEPAQAQAADAAEGEAEAPIGIGFGRVQVNPLGRLTLNGKLADGTQVAQTVPLSKDGRWPLYVSLYGGKGSILSRVTLHTNPPPATSFSGDMTWNRPALPRAKYYPEGFGRTIEVIGSVYEPPGTNKVVDIDLGMVSFEGGNLSAEFSSLVRLGTDNKVIDPTTSQPFPLNFAPASGFFNGTVRVNDNGTNRVLSFQGAVLQRQILGAGFFLGLNRSGTVRFEPAPL